MLTHLIAQRPQGSTTLAEAQRRHSDYRRPDIARECFDARTRAKTAPARFRAGVGLIEESSIWMMRSPLRSAINRARSRLHLRRGATQWPSLEGRPPHTLGLMVRRRAPAGRRSPATADSLSSLSGHLDASDLSPGDVVVASAWWMLLLHMAIQALLS